MTTRTCARAVSLDQRYYAATRAAYDPKVSHVMQVSAAAHRVELRKAMIAHVKECGLCC